MSLQTDLNAAAGKRLYLPAGIYTIDADTSMPSNILIEGDGEGTVITTYVGGSGVGQLHAIGKSNITIRNVKFATNGLISFVPTFKLSANVHIENCKFVGTMGAELSSVALRTQGSIGVTVRDCKFYDFDASMYLDEAGTTLSDLIKVLNCHFEQTVTGTSTTPSGIYQFNCKKLHVDGCTFKNIMAGVGADYGYSVYEGDGVTQALTVTNCTTVCEQSKPHVMVQNSNAKECTMTGNKIYAVGPGYPTLTYFNWLYKGGAANGNVNVSNNFADKAGIFVQGAGTAATATRHAIVANNQLQFLTQSLGGAIRIGNNGTTYVHHAEVLGNEIYNTFSSQIQISQAAFAVVEDNYCANWNTGNNTTDTQPYSMAIYWEGGGANSSIGRCNGNRLENNTQVSGETGYPVDGIVVQNAINKVRLANNSMGATVTNPYIRAMPDSWTYTPTGTNILNVAASTMYQAQFARNGNTVTVSGLVEIDPAVIGATRLGLSIPFMSNFTNSIQAGGSANSTATEDENYVIYADAVNDRIVIDGQAKSTANHAIWYQYTYQVLP